MKKLNLSSTELKRKTAEVLNLVAYGKAIAIVKRHGKPLVKISPIKKSGKKTNLTKKLKNYFGVLPDFPFPSKNRHFRQRKITL